MQGQTGTNASDNPMFKKLKPFLDFPWASARHRDCGREGTSCRHGRQSAAPLSSRGISGWYGSRSSRRDSPRSSIPDKSTMIISRADLLIILGAGPLIRSRAAVLAPVSSRTREGSWPRRSWCARIRPRRQRSWSRICSESRGLLPAIQPWRGLALPT